MTELLKADPETNVLSAYSAAATSNTGLCCPVQYDPKLLKAIPQEVLDRDYGCGTRRHT